mgnify:FL=1
MWLCTSCHRIYDGNSKRRNIDLFELNRKIKEGKSTYQIAKEFKIDETCIKERLKLLKRLTFL